MSVGSRLRALLGGSTTSYLLEAHNACSALIAEEAGFAGVWASSLTLASAAGLRDDSEIALDHVLGTVEAMTDRLSIPVLFDGDSGHGGFNQFRILVRRLARRGVAGVCIEDKLFPKSNSFIESERQQLCTVEEFVGKLHAGLDARPDRDFVIAARTEALITGAGLADALRRASAYADAGADAIVVHSKARTFAEVQQFCELWDRPTPLICIPTRYPETPRAQMEAAGIRIAIWANHLLRASVHAMQRFAARLHAQGTPGADADDLATLEELFRLQGAAELQAARARYEPAATRAAVIYPSRSAAGPANAARLDAQLRAAGWRTLVRLEDHRDDVPAALARWLDEHGAGIGTLLLVPDDLRARDACFATLDAAQGDAAILISAGAVLAGHVAVWCSARPGHDHPDLPLLLARAGAPQPDAHGTWSGAVRFSGRAVARLRGALRGEASEAAPADLSAVLATMAATGTAVHVLALCGGWFLGRSGETALNLAAAPSYAAG